MPTLVLIRHAAAEPHRADDHSRSLSPRGRAQLPPLQQWLLAAGVQPSVAIVSTATRARETWQGCAVGTVDPTYDDRVYEATPGDLLGLLREIPADLDTVVLVGHNPGLEQLAWQLDDADAARSQTDRGLGTAGVAVFALQAWPELRQGALVAFRD